MKSHLTKLAPVLAACASMTFGTPKDAHARSWVCSATFSQGNYSHGPVTFPMSGGVFADREKACRNEIHRRWLDTGDVFPLLQLSADDEESICAEGGHPNIGVSYGFDRRGKEWQFTRSVQAPFCINKALAATVTASSTYCTSAGLHCYSATRANDGDRNTTVGGFYSWTNADTALPEYLEFDLDGAHSVGRAEVYTSDGYPIADFDVEYWDGAQWRTAGTVRGNVSSYVEVSFPRVTTSHVRVVGIRGPGNQPQHVRINELELY